MIKILGEDIAPFMLDVESTGLAPTLNSLTSLAIVRFSTETLYPTDHLHFKFTDQLSNRHDDRDTMAWRVNNYVDVQEKKLTEFEIKRGLRLISNFVDEHSEGMTPVLLSKHIDFDVAFLKGYYAVKGYKFPFKHRNIFDLDSVIQGMGVDADKAYEDAKISMEKEYVHYDAKAHDALWDCLLQMQYLYAAMKQSAGIHQDGEDT